MATTINGKPVNPTTTASQPAVTVTDPTVTQQPAVKQTHAAACGEVGETGEHGDLGENAAK